MDTTSELTMTTRTLHRIVFSLLCICAVGILYVVRTLFWTPELEASAIGNHVAGGILVCAVCILASCATIMLAQWNEWRLANEKTANFSELPTGTLVIRSAHWLRVSCGRGRGQMGILTGKEFDDEDGEVMCLPVIHWEGDESPSINHPLNAKPFRKG